jgi:pimeloyl-ACP methyl ester carboxylesterase
VHNCETTSPDSNDCPRSVSTTSDSLITSALLALSHPRLFRSLILLDPVITLSNSGIGPAIASTTRRDLWDSQDAAASKFAQSKFYRAWDPRVLNLWTAHGLRDLPTELYPSSEQGDKRVTLTTTKHQELFTFLRPTYRSEPYTLPDYDRPQYPGYPFYRPEPRYAYSRLPELRPSVLYVFGAESDLSTPAERRAKMERTGTGLGGSGGAERGRVKEVVLDCGHLVAMERVPQCAEAIAGFLEGEVDSWKREQKVFDEARQGVGSRTEVNTVDERWKRELKAKI